MTGRSMSQYSLLSFLLLMLAACQPTNQIVPHQMVVEWPQQHLVFIADGWTSRVRSFQLGAGAPVLFAQTKGGQRAKIRDIQVESEHGQLWVLSDDAISVHDARSLGLQKRIPLDRKVFVLRVNADGVAMLNAAGESIGQIDGRTLVASWHTPIRHDKLREIT